MPSQDERVEVKVYMSREMLAWLTAEARRRYGKERRRNDLVELALCQFKERRRIPKPPVSVPL